MYPEPVKLEKNPLLDPTLPPTFTAFSVGFGTILPPTFTSFSVGFGTILPPTFTSFSVGFEKESCLTLGIGGVGLSFLTSLSGSDMSIPAYLLGLLNASFNQRGVEDPPHKTASEVGVSLPKSPTWKVAKITFPPSMYPLPEPNSLRP